MRAAAMAPETNVRAATNHTAAATPEKIRDHAGEQRAGRVAEVSPQAVDADCGSARDGCTASPMAASRVGYTIAVPMPSSTPPRQSPGNRR